jgi:hypothetical protein
MVETQGSTGLVGFIFVEPKISKVRLLVAFGKVMSSADISTLYRAFTQALTDVLAEHAVGPASRGRLARARGGTAFATRPDELTARQRAMGINAVPRTLAPDWVSPSGSPVTA